jgi:hypothetical protein
VCVKDRFQATKSYGSDVQEEQEEGTPRIGGQETWARRQTGAFRERPVGEARCMEPRQGDCFFGGGGADGARTSAFVLSESDDTGSSVSFDGKLRAMADVTPLPCTESEKGPRTTTHRVGCPRAAMRMDRDASGQERTTSRVGCPLLLLSPSTWVGSLHLGRPVVVVLCSVMASFSLGAGGACGLGGVACARPPHGVCKSRGWG